MSVHIRLTDREVAQFAAEFPARMQAIVSQLKSTIQLLAQGLTPVDTGALAGSVEVTEQPYGLRIRWPLPYAKYADQGAAPHLIVPRKPGGVLRFVNRLGEVVYARKVEHPGYPGWDFKARVRELLMPIIKTFVENELMKVGRGK